MKAPINYTIRESKRAKRLQLKINRLAEIEVVIPVSCNTGNRNILLSEAKLFVKNNLAWIQAQQEKILSQSTSCLSDSIAPPNTIHLPSIGTQYSIEYCASSRFKNNKLTFDQNNICVFAKNDHDKRQLLQRFLHEQAKKELGLQLDVMSKKHNLPYNRLFIRAQKTRWGSCSSKKNINLNRNLLFLQAEQVEYLLIHELCHTLHLNHSPRYWQLVMTCMPAYKTIDQSLKHAVHKVPLWAIV